MRATARRLSYLSSPLLLTAIPLLLLYLVLIGYCQRTSFADPTSLFFDPRRGYGRHYSRQRQKEADEYIQNFNLSESRERAANPPKLCIGIPTVARDGEQYVRSTIGSLLAGLSPNERNEIHLTILLAHAFPHSHPVFHETWLRSAADEVLHYNLSQQQLHQLTVWEKGKIFGKKGLFDYTYTLQSCFDTGAQWIAMIEDDTLAVDGWYNRTIRALEEADDQHRVGLQADWLYLRLFFTEQFLGWNVEESPIYITATVTVMAAVATSLILLRRHVLSRYLTDSFILIATLAYTPALIALYFAAGRLTVRPLSPGVHEMPKFGCCAQGLVFSREISSHVIKYLEKVGEGFVDELLETWADKEGLVRWAVVPSLLQHIGRHSSKGDDFGDQAQHGRSVAEKIWSFGFEKLRSLNGV